MATPIDDPAPRGKAGRPARINRAMIAEAAHEIGIEGLTLKAVADHLGVTTAALYHHVSGKDDLLRIAAEHSARTVPLPVDRGQHWAQWLMDWATYNREVFTAEPGLLGQYLEGAIPLESVVVDLDAILAVLVREGFTVSQANAAYSIVSSCALGTVVGERWQVAVAGGAGEFADACRRIVDAAPEGSLPSVTKLLTGKGARMPTFAERVVTVLRGIADEYDKPWVAPGEWADREPARAQPPARTTRGGAATDRRQVS